MILFLSLCLLLLLASGLFFLFPTLRREEGAEPGRANVEWFRLRQQELAEEGNEALAADAQLRLLEDQSLTEAAMAVDERRFPGWMLLLLVTLFSGVVYYQLGGVEDVLIARDLAGIDGDSTPEQMQALMDTIESRSAQRPDNLYYRALLARYYMGMEDYSQAASTYEALAVAAPEDAYALASAAQAAYLAAGRQLDDRARMRAEQALAIDPHQRTALGLLGMASYEQGLYRAAIDYWQRLVATEPPGSESAQMISGIIEQARVRLAEQGEQPQPVAAASPGVEVSVELPEGAALDPAATVFVLAREAGAASRMPVAVRRLTAAQLPARLRLDDSHSMAGQQLSALAAVEVVVQVSPDGRPGEENASWLGRAGPLAPSTDSEPASILLAPR